MAKVKLIYKKRQFNCQKISDIPFDYEYSTINDMAIPITMIKQNIVVLKHKKIWGDERMVVLKAEGSKQMLKQKVFMILDMYFAGKLDILLLK